MKKKKNDKKVKIFLASLTSLVMAGSVVGFSLIRSGKSESKDNTTSRSYEMSDDSSKSNYVEAHDEYEDVRLLEQLSGKSVVELNKLVKKYSTYTKCTPKEAAEILCDNYDSIVENYDDLKYGMIDTLFESALADGRLSRTCDSDNIPVETRYTIFDNVYTDPVQKNKRDAQRKEQETILLDFCNDMGMTAEETAVCLSVYRLETGHGNSDRCVEQNNYGGVKLPGSNYTFCVYQTPEFGMYMSLKCMYEGHIKVIEKNSGYTNGEDILSDMGYAYNPEIPEDWANQTISIYNIVKEDYPELKDAPKIFTR